MGIRIFQLLAVGLCLLLIAKYMQFMHATVHGLDQRAQGHPAERLPIDVLAQPLQPGRLEKKPGMLFVHPKLGLAGGLHG